MGEGVQKPDIKNKERRKPVPPSRCSPTCAGKGEGGDDRRGDAERRKKPISARVTSIMALVWAGHTEKVTFGRERKKKIAKCARTDRP